MLADKFAVEPGMVTSVIRLAEEFDAEGMERLESANELIARAEFEDGLLELQRLTILRKLSVAKAATRRLNELKRDPAVRTGMRAADAEALYDKALDLLWSAPIAPEDECADDLCETCRAAALAAAGDEPEIRVAAARAEAADEGNAELTAAWSLTPEEQVKLFEMLEDVVRRYPDSQAALQASWLLETLREDTILTGEIERFTMEKEAAKLLQLGRNYLANGKIDDARIAFSRVIQEYPESPAAEQAAQEARSIDDNERGSIPN